MSHQLWIAEALRRAGVEVTEVDGWQSRGSANFNPQGVVVHHTANGPRGDYPSLTLVRDGRAGLAGPLAQLGLGRSGRAFVIAAGRANHAGAGSWRGLGGNTSVFGIEAESVGNGSDWTQEQRSAYPRMVAALLAGMGRDERFCCGHREWAPGRKIDPAGIDLDDFRAQVANHLRGRPEPPSRGEQPMVIIHPEGHVFLLSGGVLTFLSGRAAGEANERLPVIHVDHNEFKSLEQANLALRGQPS